MSAASAVSQRVRQLRTRLESAADLRPCQEVNALFTELVGLCCTTPSPLADSALAHLDDEAAATRRLCAAGETALEQHWARRVLAADDPVAELARFPYLDNYRELVRMELGAVIAAGGELPSRVAVLGSGPLPLTGIVLARDYGAAVLHVDRDLDSLQLGGKLTAALGLDTTAAHADLDVAASEDVLRAEGIADCDVVVLAALVGQDPAGKRAVSARLARLLRPGTLVLVRSAVRLRSLLYPCVRAEDLVGLRVSLEVHPHSDVVNSVLVARA
ncbi:MAG: nicotianamine synthase [Actinophytocola sp.]|nr:nicotianamine synthase [Actinophytocola sp.]